MNNNTGSIFANKQGDKYVATHDGKELTVKEIDDQQLGITWGDHKDVLQAKFSKFGKMFLCTLGDTRYIVGKRENQRGSYFLFKKGRPAAAPDANQAAGGQPAAYGQRS